jgi:hypothetical protein
MEVYCYLSIWMEHATHECLYRSFLMQHSVGTLDPALLELAIGTQGGDNGLLYRPDSLGL